MLPLEQAYKVQHSILEYLKPLLPKLTLQSKLTIS